MNKIHNSVRNPELSGMCKSVIKMFDEEPLTDVDGFLREQKTELRRIVVQFSLAIKQNRLVSNLQEKDAVRDKCIRAVNGALKGFAVILNEQISTAAKKLLSIFKRFGLKLCTKTFIEKSSQTASLVELFYKEGSAEMKVLEGFSEAVAALEEANNDCQESYLNYSMEKASEKIRHPSATSLRAPLLEVLNEKLVPYLTAMSISDAAKYGKLASDFSSFIEILNSAVRRRLRRSKAEDEAEKAEEEE